MKYDSLFSRFRSPCGLFNPIPWVSSWANFENVGRVEKLRSVAYHLNFFLELGYKDHKRIQALLIRRRDGGRGESFSRLRKEISVGRAGQSETEGKRLHCRTFSRHGVVCWRDWEKKRRDRSIERGTRRGSTSPFLRCCESEEGKGRQNAVYENRSKASTNRRERARWPTCRRSTASRRSTRSRSLQGWRGSLRVQNKSKTSVTALWESPGSR